MSFREAGVTDGKIAIDFAAQDTYERERGGGPDVRGAPTSHVFLSNFTARTTD